MPRKKRAAHPPDILIAWIGATDLNAAGVRKDSWADKAGLGPIGQTVKVRTFDKLSLLYNYGQGEAAAYVTWLKGLTGAEITVAEPAPFRPTDHKAIYDVVDTHIETVLAEHPDARLTYHLSPGTPAMASVWLMLAHTSRPARLVASTLEHGVEDVELPFRLAFEVISGAFKAADDALTAALDSRPPTKLAFEGIVHHGENMREVIRMAKRVALTDITTLILGESGTGKERLAAAIHAASDRREQAFVPVNCGAIPPSLLESELFGYEKGAFTGANAMRKGLFEQAHGGTLFLDEVGEMPPKAQVQLLRALQNGVIRRVGGELEIPVDVRIIAATHRPLKAMVEADRFREDLYYRLAVAVLSLPPLRERPSDLPVFIDIKVDEVREKMAKQPAMAVKTVSPEARRLLMGHTWPGNVRELENVLIRAALWSRGDEIEATQVEAALRESPQRRRDIFNRPINDAFDLRAIHDEISAHYIRRALKQTGGNKTRTAEILGLGSRAVLKDWMQRCGVEET